MDKTQNIKKLYFSKLDGLRTIAFLLVFIHHFPSLAFKPMAIINARGWIGVELFFILSSFLLTKILIDEFKRKNILSVSNFFIRRVLRICPLYFLYIFLIIIFFKTPETFNNHSIGRVIGLLTFSDNIWSSVFGYNGVIWIFFGHLWTISLEVQYYLILPFIIPFLIKLTKKQLSFIASFVLIFLIIFRLAAVLMEVGYQYIWVLPIQGDGFLLGTMYALGLFDNFLKKLNNTFKMFIGLFFVLMSFELSNVHIMGYHQIILYTVVSIGFLFIVDGIINNKNKWSEIIFGNSIAQYLGKISYGLYVYHVVCISLSTDILTKYSIIGQQINNSWFISFMSSLLLTIIISSLSYELFEKLFLKLKNNFS